MREKQEPIQIFPIEIRYCTFEINSRMNHKLVSHENSGSLLLFSDVKIEMIILTSHIIVIRGLKSSFQ